MYLGMGKEKKRFFMDIEKEKRRIMMRETGRGNENRNAKGAKSK